MSNREPGPVARELMKGAAFFEDKRNWCKGDEHRKTFWRGRDKYCALGYLKRDGWTDLSSDAWRQLCLTSYANYEANPVFVNDYEGREAIVQLYRAAAQHAVLEGV